MTLQENMQQLYGIVLKITFALIFYIPTQYINNETSKIILFLLSFGFFALSLFEILKYYFSKHRAFYLQYKIPILFALFAVVIIVIFIILYLHQGEVNTLFWSTLIPTIMGYFIALIMVLSRLC